MRPRPILAGLLALALLPGTLPAAPVTAADPERDLIDAASFELAVAAIMDAEGQRTGATWKRLDAATRTAVTAHIGYLKGLREELKAEHDRLLARYPGPEHACERAEIGRQKAALDASFARTLQQLRRVRGDRRSAPTRAWRAFQRDILKPLGRKVLEPALKLTLRELALTYVSGGSLSLGLAKQVGRRTLARVVRREGRDLLRRGLERTALGGRARTSEDALAEICAEQTAAGAALPGGESRTAGAGAYACSLECEHCAELPPYDEPAFLIYLEWGQQADVRLDYWLAEPGAEPYSGAYWSGGCIDGPPPRTCSPIEPLILTEAAVGGKNVWGYRGNLQLTVEAVPCVFADDVPDDPFEEGPRHLAVCERISQVPVTAGIHYVAAGSEVGVRVAEPVAGSAPLYPCQGPWPDPAPYRRIIETFEWSPETGITFADQERRAGAAPAIPGSDEDAPWDQE